MDCRYFKELLDSYLCDELAVETNHQMHRHVECCPGCCRELGARREMRRVLKIACGKQQLSQEARARICTKLRAGQTTLSFWRRIVSRLGSFK